MNLQRQRLTSISKGHNLQETYCEGNVSPSYLFTVAHAIKQSPNLCWMMFRYRKIIFSFFLKNQHIIKLGSQPYVSLIHLLQKAIQCYLNPTAMNIYQLLLFFWLILAWANTDTHVNKFTRMPFVPDSVNTIEHRQCCGIENFPLPHPFSFYFILFQFLFNSLCINTKCDVFKPPKTVDLGELKISFFQQTYSVCLTQEMKDHKRPQSYFLSRTEIKEFHGYKL